MHIENELVEFAITSEEEYGKEIPIQEGVLELTDTADTVPAQGKPRCIILIFYNHRIYIYCAFTLQEFYENHYIYIFSMYYPGTE
jgi:hypothetical protein